MQIIVSISNDKIALYLLHPLLSFACYLFKSNFFFNDGIPSEG